MLSLIVSLSLLAVSTAYPTEAWPRSLIITPSPPSGSLDPCLRDNYFGSYGSTQEHIYLTGPECFQHGLLQSFASGWMVPLSQDPMSGRIVWIGQAGVEGMQGYHVGDAWSSIEEKVNLLAIPGQPHEEHHDQAVLGGERVAHPTIEVLHGSKTSLLLHVPNTLLPILDTLLPPHLVPVVLPTSPLPMRTTANGWEPIPDKFAKHLAKLTSGLKFDSKLDKILEEGIQLDDVRRNVRWLTGEAPSGIESRHSFTPGALKAAHWLKEKTEATGAKCDLEPFLYGFSPNVICTYPSLSNSSELVILSAHYDSRGSWGSTRAPGGDDDGSGTGHLLAVAKAIGEAKLKFDKRVILAFFAGEEQGLYGSHAFAQKLYEKNATVLLHIQADMLGYHAPGEPMQLGLPESIHLPEASYLVGNLSQLYSPELLLGVTAACCSDHQSFMSFGFPATAVFERAGPIADPKYHNSGDLSQREGYDFDQIVSIAKVTMASILTIAGWSV